MDLIVIILFTIFGIGVLLGINYFLLKDLYLQFKRLKDTRYIKKQMKSNKWMGQPITKELVKDMTHTCAIISTGAFFISFISYFNTGLSLTFTFTICVAIMMLYAAFIWDQYIIRTNNVLHNKHTVKLTKIMFEIVFFGFLALLIYAGTIKENIIESFELRIILISLTLAIIGFNELHYYLIKKK